MTDFSRKVMPSGPGMRDGFHADIRITLTGPEGRGILPPICLSVQQERFTFQDYMNPCQARVFAAALNEAADAAEAQESASKEGAA